MLPSTTTSTNQLDPASLGLIAQGFQALNGGTNEIILKNNHA